MPRFILFLIIAFGGTIACATSAVIAQQTPISNPATFGPLRAPGSQPLGTFAAPTAAARDQQTSGSTAALPNGANAINEVYGDWTVDCRIAESQKRCILSQSQGDSRTGQRLFGIELRVPRDDRVEGAIMVPLGVKLENGAILKLDEKDLGQDLRFSTCVPAGCLLPVSFPTAAIDSMKVGKKLVVATLNLSNGEAIIFNVPLNGFRAALARLVQLGE